MSNNSLSRRRLITLPRSACRAFLAQLHHDPRQVYRNLDVPCTIVVILWLAKCLVWRKLGREVTKRRGVSKCRPVLWSSSGRRVPACIHGFLLSSPIYIVESDVTCTEAQRYHCKYNLAAASFILLPRDLFQCREFHYTAASFILLPRDLFQRREFYCTAASFVLPPRVLFSPPRDLFYRREFYFHVKSRGRKIKLAAEKIKLAGVKIKVAVVKIKLAAVKQNSRQ